VAGSVAALLLLGCAATSAPHEGAPDGDELGGHEAAGGSAGKPAGGDDAGAAGGEPAPVPCAGKSCGSDQVAKQFCGPPCPAGQGCSAAGSCGAWPPDIDSFYDGYEGWQLPPCSTGDEAGSNLDEASSHYWVKTMVTTGTDCPKVVQDAHPMVQVGNVATEDTSVPVDGSCVSFYGEQWGTAYEGVVVWGASWPNEFAGIEYVINWRAVIDHNLTPARGIGIAHLTRLAGIDCSIEMDVTYERCPEDRQDCGQHPAPF
jgi:hypothetical protein